MIIVSVGAHCETPDDWDGVHMHWEGTKIHQV